MSAWKFRVVIFRSHRGRIAHGRRIPAVVILHCNHRDDHHVHCFGYELTDSTPVPTHMVLMLSTNLSRGQTYLVADRMQRLSHDVPPHFYTDGFGNVCTRIELPSGPTRISADALIEDPGTTDPIAPSAQEHPVRELPSEVLQFLLSSRYCDTEVLMAEALASFRAHGAGVATGTGRLRLRPPARQL